MRVMPTVLLGPDGHPATGQLLATMQAIVNEAAKPRAFVPRPCSACRALREVGTNYSRVYATRHDGATIVRYIRCDFCGNTYRQTGE